MPWRADYRLVDLRHDLVGGITAGVVVLPSALAYGAISGLGPAAGLYGAIAVCICTAILGGTRGLISGPSIFVAVAMSVVVTEYATSMAQAATAGILAGLVQMAFGVFRLGHYVSYIPFSVVSGFFSAVGILLIIKQGVVALGSAPDGRSMIDSVRAWPEAAAALNLDAVILTALCLAVGVLWRGWLRRVSPNLFAVLVVGTLAGALWLRDAPTVGEISLALPIPQLSVITPGFFLRVLEPAFIMALLGAMDALTMALRVDAFTGAQHRPNRELVAQGVGNIAAGLVGGLPGGANTAGTFANVLSGGRSPVAGITVALLLLAVPIALGSIAERVPYAVLAAIMMLVGWQLIDWRFVTRIHRVSRGYALVMLLTCFLVLFVDIIAGVVVGLVIAAVSGARRIQHLETTSLISVPLLDRLVLGDADCEDGDPYEARTGLVRFPERVTLASAREVSRMVRPDIRGHQITIFDLSPTVYIDDSAAVMISELIRIAIARRPGSVIISGLNDGVASTLNSMGLLNQMPKGNFATDLEDAKRIIRPMLLQTRPGVDHLTPR